MLATTSKHVSEISINLREAAQRKVPKMEQQSLEIAIDEQGRVFIDRQAVVNSDIAMVRRAMQKAAGARKELAVTISADAHTLRQSVITVIDAARQLGLQKIGIKTALQQSKIPAN